MPQHSVEDIVAAFHAEGLTDAAPHNLGLARFCRDPTEYARALKRCQPQPTRLRVVTMPADQPDTCDQTYTCPCEKCRGNVASITPKGAGAAAFKVRAPRVAERHAA